MSTGNKSPVADKVQFWEPLGFPTLEAYWQDRFTRLTFLENLPGESKPTNEPRLRFVERWPYPSPKT